MTRMPERGKTIREAIAIALEGLAGDLTEWVLISQHYAAMRVHVVNWVHDYAVHRGVVLNDKDIEDELDAVVREIRQKIT